MSSRHLPKSAKVDSLPDDLKRIANKLLKEKFKTEDVKPEPEVLRSEEINTYRHVYYLRPRRVLDYGRYESVGNRQSIPRELYIQGIQQDPVSIASNLGREVTRLMQYWGVEFEITTNDGRLVDLRDIGVDTSRMMEYRDPRVNRFY